MTAHADEELTVIEGRMELRAAPAGGKSRAGATVLSFLLGGLGHLYVGETARGLALIAAIGVSVAAAIASDTIGPAGLVTLFAAADAYQGAGHRNRTGTPRPITWGVWALLALMVIIAVPALVADTGAAAAGSPGPGPGSPGALSP